MVYLTTCLSLILNKNSFENLIIMSGALSLAVSNLRSETKDS